jgi:hypothetical protein
VYIYIYIYIYADFILGYKINKHYEQKTEYIEPLMLYIEGPINIVFLKKEKKRNLTTCNSISTAGIFHVS